MEQISKYFNAERGESLLFAAIGLVAIILGSYFLIKIKQPFYNGMAIPLVLIALIQLTVGASVYFRSPKDILKVENMISNDKEKIKTEEIPRMETVMKFFLIYRYVELVLMIAGLILMFTFKENEFIKGVGIGLFIQAALMLTLDFFAEKRGHEYLTFLINLSAK
ncbi:MAG: hypothetical protein V4549_12835 [Bacteroidota bacterium]